MRQWLNSHPLVVLFLVLAMGMSAIAVDGSAWRTEFLPGGGRYETSLPTLTDAQQDEFHLDSSARLIVSIGANTAGTSTQEVVGDAADGAAVAGNPVLVAGQDGTNAQSLKTDTTGSLQVDIESVPAPLSSTGAGTEAAALRVTLATDSTGLVSVDDNAGSLTVDNAQLSVVGGGAEATAMRVTVANDSTGVISVDDNAGALTVDWAGTAPPIGAGLEATALRVTLATDSTGLVSVDDNAGSLTVDSAQMPAALGGGAEAGAMLVTIANNSTGLVSVDDNGANISVDWGGTVPPIGAGVEATALRVTLATDSTGLISVDDNAGSLTVDGPALTVAQTAASNDLNTAVGADVDAAVGASANLRYLGFAVYETAGAAASFMIVNGATGAAAGKIDPIYLAANGSASRWYGPEGVAAPLGISIDWLSGAFTVVIFYKDLP